MPSLEFPDFVIWAYATKENLENSADISKGSLTILEYTKVAESVHGLKLFIVVLNFEGYAISH